MRYELFEATFIIDLYTLEQHNKDATAEEQISSFRRSGDSVYLSAGLYHFQWKKGLLGARIVGEYSELSNRFHVLTQTDVSDCLTAFCTKYSIPLSSIIPDKSSQSIKNELYLQSGGSCVLEGTFTTFWHWRLDISSQRLQELYYSLLNSDSQEKLRRIGQQFFEKAQKYDFIKNFSDLEYKAATDPFKYTVCVDEKGIYSSFNSKCIFADYNLRELKTDEEMIGVGLAAIQEFIQAHTDLYIFQRPIISSRESRNVVSKVQHKTIIVSVSGTKRNCKLSDW